MEKVLSEHLQRRKLTEKEMNNKNKPTCANSTLDGQKQEKKLQYAIEGEDTATEPGRGDREEATKHISSSGEQRASRSVQSPTDSGRFDLHRLYKG